MSRALFHFIFVPLFIASVGAQESPKFEEILGKLASYSTKQAPEKVYAHLDREFYNQGDTVWFKIYLVDGISHVPSDKSKVVYVELMDLQNNIVAQQKLLVENMGANGDIIIPETLESGKYMFRTYTKYMLNENEPKPYVKYIFIGNEEPDGKIKSPQKGALNKPVVHFFPEGGNLVSGINTVLAIKCTNPTGGGISVKGKILDQNNQLVSVFESSDYGLASVSFKPKFGNTYRATVAVDDREYSFPVPETRKEGYVLNAKNNGENLLLKISTSYKKGLEGAFILGHLRGKTFFKRTIDSNRKTYTVKILTENIRDGVAHFTLFTREGEPVCERLLFVHHTENEVVASVKTNSKTYGPREKIEVELGLTDREGNPLYGNLSSSIRWETERSLDGNTGIVSWLLLDSEIGHTFLDSDLFFDKIGNSNRHHLDLLMLTHGWRRFVWKELLQNKVGKQLSHEPEKGIMITGKTTRFNNPYSPRKSSVKLSILGEPFFQGENPTDSQGRFNFGPFIFYDTIHAFVRAKSLDYSKRAKDNELEIVLNGTFPKINPEEPYPATIKPSLEKEVTAPFPYKPTAPSQFGLSSKITRLKGVTVKARKKTRKEIIDEEIRKFTIYAEPSNRVFRDSTFGIAALTIFDLLQNVPGVRVSPDQRVSIRSGFSAATGDPNGGDEGGDQGINNRPREPLFLLDGIQVTSGFLQTFSPYEVEFIDVLRGPRAAIYGVRAAQGVIAVYTKGKLNTILRDTPSKQPGSLSMKLGGFYKVREFFGPDYSIPAPKHHQMDYRNTLHWEPNIDMDPNGKSSFDFFAGDIPGKYLVKTEGITLDGRPINVSYSFTVDGGF